MPAVRLADRRRMSAIHPSDCSGSPSSGTMPTRAILRPTGGGRQASADAGSRFPAPLVAAKFFYEDFFPEAPIVGRIQYTRETFL